MAHARPAPTIAGDGTRRAVQVRSMRPDDVPAVTTIERAVFGSEAWPRGAFAYACHVFASARPARGRLWVAVAPGKRVVGYTGVEVSTLGGEADIVNLAVDPGYRRRGVGRLLLAHAVAHCRRRGVALLWLRVRARNRGARAFYRRCGFLAAGRFRGYYDDPQDDAILMATRPR